MRKFIITAELRALEKKVNLGQISYQKMIDILCEKADEYHESKVKELSQHGVIKAVCLCKIPKYNYPEMLWCDDCGKEISKKQTVL